MNIKGDSTITEIIVTANTKSLEKNTDLNNCLQLIKETDKKLAILTSCTTMDDNQNSFLKSVRSDCVIDLDIRIPLNLNLIIFDGAGNIKIDNLKGSLFIDDASGNITISNIIGNVEVKDKSGNIDVLNVNGGVKIEDSISGNINLTNIDMNVEITKTGSGDIKTENIKGNVIRN